MIKERPILFSTAMVQGILNGTKTQTRRIAKVTDKDCDAGMIMPFNGLVPRRIEKHIKYCPYGVIGDRLWVRETCIITPVNWNDGSDCNCIDNYGHKRMVQYLATESDTEGAEMYKLITTPSIHMPRWASRILLEITNVRVERLQDISEEDAIAEGAHVDKSFPKILRRSTRSNFEYLWESINGKGSWDLNPYVWVFDFKVIK